MLNVEFVLNIFYINFHQQNGGLSMELIVKLGINTEV